MAISQITDLEKCCGCSVCADICPKSSITMQTNNEGFLYPVINPATCIECNICQKYCSVNTCSNTLQDHLTFEQEVYACRNVSNEILMKSSSGGVFYELAKLTLAKGGVVYGADFDVQHVVRHIKISTLADVDRLLGSKYVQSDKRGIWKDVHNELLTGHNVLFCGTPCEIGALRNFLRKDYENLLCVDFICMGTPSPEVWRRHITDIETYYKEKAETISFRTKKYGAYTHSLSLSFPSGRKYWRPQFAEPYVKAFHSRLYLRKSCHKCSYKKIHRDSDITMADFWGIQNTDIPIQTDKGVSMLIIQSPKGKAEFDKVKCYFELYKTTIEVAKQVQPMMVSSCKADPKRSEFFEDFISNPNEKLARIISKYVSITIYEVLRSKLKQIDFLRRIVQKYKK